MTILEMEPLMKGAGVRFIPCDEFQRGEDGRTLEGMIVPYGQVTTVIEPDAETGKLVKYQEQFLRGSLAGMAQGFKARGLLDVPLLMGHTQDTIQNRIGYATALHDRSDGAWATFRVYDDANLPKVLSMLRESHTGLSVAFRDTRQPRLIDGVVSRVQVFVSHVAATPVPTYTGAGITAMRSDDPLEAARPNVEAVRAWLQQERNANQS